MSGDVRDRLRRLRREGDSAPGPKGAGANPDGKGMPTWLRARLARGTLLPALGSAGDPTATVGEPLNLSCGRSELGDFAERVTLFDAHHRHGDWALDEVRHVTPGELALLAGDQEVERLDPLDAVYLDIETTGLSGGAGVYPFLIALGRFRDGRFELWQGFLRDPGEEPALLAECARRVAESSGVISFFGKSFDRHRLEDKMRVCGVDPPFAARPHLDLYHPLASIYRGAWLDGRLCTVESELCGLRREDDLSGAFAPAAWFDFLGDRAHRLEAVFRHNLDDVLSLATLTAHLGRSLAEERSDGTALSGPSALRARGVARAYERAGNRERAVAWLGTALERLSEHHDPNRRPWHSERADLLRLLGQTEQALAAYRALGTDAEDGWTVRALLQEAKLLEHQVRDVDAALDACQRAAALLARCCTGRTYATLRADLEPRLERLVRKAGK